MGILDRSSSVTQNLTEQVNRPVNVQDSAGAQVFDTGGGDIYAVSTDYNAIGSATELARASVEAGVKSAEGANDLALSVSRMAFQSSESLANLVADSSSENLRATQSLARDTTYATADIAGRAIDSAEASRSQIADIAESANSRIQSTAQGALNTSLDFVRGLQTKFQDTVSSTVDALQRIGVEQNKSTDQRVAEVSQNATKYVVIGLVVLGVATVAVFALRK